MPSLKKFTDLMYYYCEEVSVGYDWARRWDVWDGGDTDCSALVITCLKEAGFDTGWATYTGNMSDALCANGWERLSPNISNAQAGDILLNDADHVAAVLWGEGWGATIGQASIGETGGVYGNQPGDQTGYETNTGPIYNYPWDCILRYTEEEEYVMPEQKPGNPINNAGLAYRVHCQTIGWQDAVRDGQVAGTEGYSCRMEALKIRPPKGYKFRVKAHIQDIGWKVYIVDGNAASSGEGSSDGDPIIGTTGQSKRLECIEIEVIERPAGDKKKLYYQIHQENYGWKAWTEEGFPTGSEGEQMRLEAIRMKLE